MTDDIFNLWLKDQIAEINEKMLDEELFDRCVLAVKMHDKIDCLVSLPGFDHRLLERILQILVNEVQLLSFRPLMGKNLVLVKSIGQLNGKACCLLLIIPV